MLSSSKVVHIGRTKGAVQYLLATGKLPAVKSDWQVLLDNHDLDRWIEEHKGETNGGQL